MAEVKRLSDSKIGERYYHIIGIEPISGLYSAHAFWRDCSEVSRNSIESVGNSAFSVEIGDYQSNFRYHSGEDNYSHEGKDQPPFFYKLFAITNHSTGHIFLAFPFRSLARTIISKLIEKKNIKQKCNFLMTDLDKLLRRANESSFLGDALFSIGFSSIELSLIGEKKINTIKIDGEKPLDSDLYKDVFLKKVQNKTCGLQKCILKTLVSEEYEGVPRTRSHIHIDLFGNNRVYIHSTGNNIYTIPLIYEMFKKLKCIKISTTNPLNRNSL